MVSSGDSNYVENALETVEVACYRQLIRFLAVGAVHEAYQIAVVLKLLGLV